MIELTFEILLLLGVTAFIAGTIDAMAGGGGLLTIPVLMTTGLPPHMVLGTNLVQSSCGTAVAVWRFAREKLIEWRKMFFVISMAAIGAAIGSFAVQQLDPEVLKPLMPFLIMGVALYFLFSKRMSDNDTHARISMPVYASTFAPAIGFYAGFLGPGTGSFFAASLIAFKGMSVKRATANTKILNLMANLAALAMFIFGGKVVWLIGAVMIPGQILGGFVGSHLAMRHGSKLIKPVLVVVCLALSVKLLFV